MLKCIAAAAAVALATAGLALAAGSAKVTLSATLTPKAEVPAPKGAAGASGSFRATVVATSSTVKVTYTLTFKGLTGPATASHIHVGKVGVAGPVAAALCGPCHTGQHGTVVVTKAQWAAIAKGGAYVNVHTAKNPGGEIRGQLKVSR